MNINTTSIVCEFLNQYYKTEPGFWFDKGEILVDVSGVEIWLKAADGYIKFSEFFPKPEYQPIYITDPDWDSKLLSILKKLAIVISKGI